MNLNAMVDMLTVQKAIAIGLGGAFGLWLFVILYPVGMGNPWRYIVAIGGGLVAMAAAGTFLEAPEDRAASTY
ncbi:MAG: hypothetical protein QOJ65_1854 [Fimbriimonadaceae bacterium]|jgi:hypothetical protein|nr:hypothetical protein [Fimbriimonadaceae bacterium]